MKTARRDICNGRVPASATARRGDVKKTGGLMSNEKAEKKEKVLGLFKRFVVWLAWQFLRPKCADCPARFVCEYAKVFEDAQTKKSKE